MPVGGVAFYDGGRAAQRPGCKEAEQPISTELRNAAPPHEHNSQATTFYRLNGVRFPHGVVL